MKLGVPLGRNLTAALLATFVPASFGFWGPTLVAMPSAAPGPEPGSERWLDVPIEPVRSDRDETDLGLSSTSTPRRNPFLKAGEQGVEYYGATPVAAPRTEPAPRTESAPRVSAYPRLKAVVRVGGERVALLDDRIVRAGDRVAGVEVLRVEERRVLVRGAAGARWLELAVGVVSGGEEP